MERALGSRYRLGDPLGQGAMGEVFLGVDTAGREYAFKVLRRDLTASPDVVARFLQERSILVGLRHPNLVGVHDLVVEGDTVAIVMDRVPGGDLRRALSAEGALLPAEVARIGAGVAAALAVVHDAGVVHRDVKPENVLLDSSAVPAVPRLTDFGISRLITPTDTGRSTLLVGTPEYVAPELADGAEPSPAADLYSLGIVLYELCCGVTPFAGGSVLAVLRRHAELDPGRPDGIPDPLWDLVSWLLAKGPRGRPQSARQVATLLDALATDLRGVPVAPRLTTPPQPAASVHGQPTQGVAGHAGGVPGHAGVPARRPAGRRGRWTVAAVALLALGGVVLSRAGGGSTSAATGGGGVPSPTASNPEPPSPTATSTPSSTSAPSTAPNLVGMPLSDATALLPGVQIKTIDAVDERTTDGTVLNQEPAPGASLNGTMRLTVARQPVLAFLDAFTPVTGEWDEVRAVDLSGKTYPHGVGMYVTSCYGQDAVEYNLSRGYRRLVATPGIEDNAEDSSLQMQLEVFADGRRVSVHRIRYGTPANLTIDVTGVLRLKVQWQPVGGDPSCGSDLLVLGEARLLGLPGEVPQSTESPVDGATETPADPTGLTN
jgi:serine/threonine protein kinase